MQVISARPAGSKPIRDLEAVMTVTAPLVPLGAVLADRDPRTVFLEAAKESGQALLDGAIRVTLADFAGPEGPSTGRLPLPDHGAFSHWLSTHGIAPATPVVVVRAGEGDLATAARAWLTLRWAGVREVRVLQDGLSADLAAAPGFAARPSVSAKPESFLVAEPVTVDADGVAGRSPDALLIDARPAEAFGDESQHFPGAISVPSALLSEGGRILPADRLREVYAATIGATIDDRPVLAYCGSGVAASVQALALASIGVAAPVYVGSWSEWSKRAAAPHAP